MTPTALLAATRIRADHVRCLLMDTFASTSFDAYTRLLAQPDPADLPRRAHVCRYEGDPNRRDTRLPGIVTERRQRRNLELDVEDQVPRAPWNRVV